MPSMLAASPPAFALTPRRPMMPEYKVLFASDALKSVTSLQAGDLVMFGKSGINHVAIYIGGGQIIHASTPSTGVRIDSLSTGYYNNNYVGARRIR